MQKFARDLIPPSPYVIEVPMKHKRGNICRVGNKPLDVLLPHDWFAALQDLPGDIMGLDKLESFWDGQSLQDPKLFDNEVLNIEGYSRCVLPITLHGDAGRFKQRDSVLVLSMRSLLATGPVSKTQLVLALLPKSVRVRGLLGNTMKVIWKTLAWSFAAMFAGKHPSFNEDGVAFDPLSERGRLAGQPLRADGKRAWLYAVLGDMEYFSTELGLNHHASHSPCWRCAANTTDRPWNDFRPTADWRGTIYSPQQLRAAPPTTHVLLTIPGVTPECFHFDALHILELGVSQHVIGNVFFEIVYEELAAVPHAEAVTRLFNWILAEYVHLNIPSSNRIGDLKLENFCDPKRPFADYPVLSKIKARETRYLLPVALRLCQRFQTASEHSRHRTKCVAGLLQACETMDAGGMFLDHAGHGALQRGIMACLVHATWLCTHAHAMRQMKWWVVPKFHYAAHIPDQGQFINPRMVWTYAGESVVGILMVLGRSCLAGTAAPKVPARALAKYRLASHLRLTRNTEDE